MKLAIMQSYFFPYIGYFQLISSVDKFILYENLNFIKEKWMTRNRIRIRSSKTAYINVPVAAKSSNKKISEISLVNNLFWKRKMLKTIDVNYRGCSYFNEVYPHIQEMVNYKETGLHYYNSHIIGSICRLLGITSSITSHNEQYLELELNLKNIGHNEYPHAYEGVPVRTVRAVKISQQENAGIFINAEGGERLYSKSDFKRFGIELYFLRTKEQPSHNEDGSPNGYFSIIDTLFNHGIEQTKAKLSNYELF